jgi:hypothetical protein
MEGVKLMNMESHHWKNIGTTPRGETAYGMIGQHPRRLEGVPSVVWVKLLQRAEEKAGIKPVWEREENDGN